MEKLCSHIFFACFLEAHRGWTASGRCEIIRVYASRRCASRVLILWYSTWKLRSRPTCWCYLPLDCKLSRNQPVELCIVVFGDVSFRFEDHTPDMVGKLSTEAPQGARATFTDTFYQPRMRYAARVNHPDSRAT